MYILIDKSMLLKGREAGAFFRNSSRSSLCSPLALANNKCANRPRIKKRRFTKRRTRKCARACLPPEVLIKGGHYWRQVDWSSSVSSTRAGGSTSRHRQRFFPLIVCCCYFVWGDSLLSFSVSSASALARPASYTQSAPIFDSPVPVAFNHFEKAQPRTHWQSSI